MENRSNKTRGPKGKDYRFAIVEDSTPSTLGFEHTTYKNGVEHTENIKEKKPLVPSVPSNSTLNELEKKNKISSHNTQGSVPTYATYESEDNSLKPQHENARTLSVDDTWYQPLTAKEKVLDKKEITSTTAVDESWSRPIDGSF